MKQSIVMVASYGGPYGGNFIPSLIAYDKVAKELGYRTVYIFPGFVSEYPWVSEMQTVADKVYFVPYHQYTLDNVKRIRRICKEENAAIVYSRMSGWDITARLAMPRLPMIWHMEMELHLDSIKQKIKYWVKYRMIGGGKTYHISVSKNTANIIDSLGVRNKCCWIPNAISTERLNCKNREQLKVPVRLLTFAYRPIVKGFDLALDACEELNKNSVGFILKTSAQPDTFEYIKNRYGENVPEWIELIKPLENISDLYDNADIMLSPSRSEGFSYCLAEALYSGLPAVYSDVPGTSWADEMKMTYKFETGNGNELADAILKCANTPVTEKEQQYNRRLISEKYTIQAWMDKIRDYLESVRKSSRKGIDE